MSWKVLETGMSLLRLKVSAIVFSNKSQCQHISSVCYYICDSNIEVIDNSKRTKVWLIV